MTAKQIDLVNIREYDLQPKYSISINFQPYLNELSNLIRTALYEKGYHDFLKQLHRKGVYIPGYKTRLDDNGKYHLVLGNLLNNRAERIYTLHSVDEFIEVLRYSKQLIEIEGTRYRILGLTESNKSKKVDVPAHSLHQLYVSDSYLSEFTLYSLIAAYHYWHNATRAFMPCYQTHLQSDHVSGNTYSLLESGENDLEPLELIKIIEDFVNKHQSLKTIKDLICFNTWEIFSVDEIDHYRLHIENLGDYRILDWEEKYESQLESEKKLNTLL